MRTLREILASEGFTTRLAEDLQVKEYEGEEGDRSHLTRVETGFVRTLFLVRIRGSRGERRQWYQKNGEWFFGNYTKADWEAFLADIKQNGIKEPIFITKDWNKDPVINEGNHRLQAAIQLNLRKVPVEIRYFGHSERQGLVGRER